MNTYLWWFGLRARQWVLRSALQFGYTVNWRHTHSVWHSIHGKPRLWRNSLHWAHLHLHTRKMATNINDRGNATVIRTRVKVNAGWHWWISSADRSKQIDIYCTTLNSNTGISTRQCEYQGARTFCQIWRFDIVAFGACARSLRNMRCDDTATKDVPNSLVISR